MKKLLFIFFIISQYTFAQLIVHDRNDKKLIAYRDSVKCYLHGLNEIRIAKSINRANKNDTAIGRFYKYYVETEMEKLNPDIKPIVQLNQYAVLYKLRPISEEHELYTLIYLEQVSWIPEMWKKPVVKVVYEELKKEKPKPLVLKKDTSKIKYNYVFTLNGKIVSQQEFENIYGKKIAINKN